MYYFIRMQLRKCDYKSSFLRQITQLHKCLNYYLFSSIFLLPIFIHQFYIFWESNDVYIEYFVH